MRPDIIMRITAIFAAGNEAIDKDDLIHKIFPENPWDIVIQLSSFVILLLIVFFIGYKPVRKNLQKSDGCSRNDFSH